MGHMRMQIIFWLENLKEKDHLEDISVDGKITSERIFGKYGRKV
jgi:hypothetical protein